MTRLGARNKLVRTALFGTVLSALAFLFGSWLSSRVPHALLASFMQFSLGGVAVVWFFSLLTHNKLSDVTEWEGIDYRQHRDLEVEVRSRISWFWFRALFLAIMATILYMPTMIERAEMAAPPWIHGLAFSALALSFYALRTVWQELEEIRELKSYVRELERREKERATKVAELKDGLREKWQSDESLDGFRDDDAHRR